MRDVRDMEREAASMKPPQTFEIVEEITQERLRQMLVEGWTPEHDDEHSDFQMARAAGVYALGVWHAHLALAPFWPWELSWWKVKSPRRDLIRAGALIVAEIERLDRMAERTSGIQKAEG